MNLEVDFEIVFENFIQPVISSRFIDTLTLLNMIDYINWLLQVNHFPGSGYITNKVNLATSGLPHVPVAFKIPQQKSELIDYVNSYHYYYTFTFSVCLVAGNRMVLVEITLAIMINTFIHSSDDYLEVHAWLSHDLFVRMINSYFRCIIIDWMMIGSDNWVELMMNFDVWMRVINIYEWYFHGILISMLFNSPSTKLKINEFGGITFNELAF